MKLRFSAAVLSHDNPFTLHGRAPRQVLPESLVRNMEHDGEHTGCLETTSNVNLSSCYALRRLPSSCVSMPHTPVNRIAQPQLSINYSQLKIL